MQLDYGSFTPVVMIVIGSFLGAGVVATFLKKWTKSEVLEANHDRDKRIDDMELEIAHLKEMIKHMQNGRERALVYQGQAMGITNQIEVKQLILKAIEAQDIHIEGII